MYKHVVETSRRINTTLVTLLLCATAAQANVYEPSQTKPLALAEAFAPALVSKAQYLAQTQPWLTPAPVATTLLLTRDGIAPLGVAGPGPGLPLAAFTTSGRANARMDDPISIHPADQVDLTTASIRSARPSSDASGNSSADYAIRQDLSLFGAHRIRFGKIRSGIKISGLIRKAAASDSSAICVNQCAALADRLTLKGAPIGEQLRHISASVNNMVAYSTDQQNHGRLDYWSTPNETLRRSSGDCEDYAILKMALLSHLGIPMTAMEIVVVKDTSRRLFHAVLSVSMGGNSLILDNMTDAVETDRAKRNYAPLFSISGAANYIFGYKGGKSSLTASVGNIQSVAPGAGF